MNHWRKTGRQRKILRARTMKELNNYISEAKDRLWFPISKVQEVNGRFEVLVELKNGRFKQQESDSKCQQL